MNHARWIAGSWLLAAALGCTAAPEASAPRAHWSYEGDTGPSHWGELSPEYELARNGKRQSPVDIVPSQAEPKDAPPILPGYHDTSLEILNNGHTIEDDDHGGGSLTIDGHEYRLAQFHFHSPSEHTVDGRHFPMELHLVHKDASGKLAVLSVLIEEGRAHPELAILWQHLPTEPGRKNAVAGVSVNAAKLLPTSLATWRYEGSLTTPPCSEDVAWFVLQRPIEASSAQIAAFRDVIHGNNRPTQPLHGRVIHAAR